MSDTGVYNNDAHGEWHVCAGCTALNAAAGFSGLLLHSVRSGVRTPCAATSFSMRPNPSRIDIKKSWLLEILKNALHLNIF